MGKITLVNGKDTLELTDTSRGLDQAFILKDEYRIHLYGVDIGPAKLIARGRNIWLIHVPSFKYWSSLYQPWSNAPARYYIAMYYQEPNDGHNVTERLRFMYEVEPGYRSRWVKKFLIKFYDMEPV